MIEDAKSLRLVVRLPAPASLSEYAPFTAVGTSPYGFASVRTGSQRALSDVAGACRKAAASGATVGYCAVEPVKAVFFDMDGTVINEESLVELAAYAGVGEHVAKVTERAMAGELDFAAALRERVALLRGLSADLLPVVAERLTLMRGIEAFVAFCRARHVPAFLVSGGFVQLAAPVVRRVGFAGFRGNTLGTQAGKLTGTVEGTIVDAQGKLEYLLETCRALGIAPGSVAAVGDGANDLPMLTAAGVSVGHRPKPVLLPHVQAVNAAGDHAFLAPLLFGSALEEKGPG